MNENEKSNIRKEIEVRRYPYPYSAMLAICSDLDETPDSETYFEILNYLNTIEKTKIGPGVGLEIGNTIYFDMPKANFSYWNADDRSRRSIRGLIQSGHIDCIHSYGDLAIERKDALRTIDELSHYNCEMKVWIDHGTAPSNLGADIMRGFGDVRGSAVYHSDATCAYGIEYVWRGRVSSVFGQNTKSTVLKTLDKRHLIASSKTVMKEYSKYILGRLGNIKYSMHGENRVMRKINLRDGNAVYEFMRSNPHWRGISCGDTADGITTILTKEKLDELSNREGVCVLYTHLGKISKRSRIFNKNTKKAFERLKHYEQIKKILVTTTYKLLSYLRMVEEIEVDVQIKSGKTIIDLQSSYSPKDMSGLTLIVKNLQNTIITINGQKHTEFAKAEKDRDGNNIFMLPWKRLNFNLLK